MSNVSSFVRAGTQAFNQGRLPQAKEQFLQAIALDPAMPQALMYLSYIESKFGHYRDALDYALRLFRARPTDLPTKLQGMNRLRNFNQTWALRELIDDPAFLAPTDPKALHAVSAQLSYIGDQRGACDLLTRALARQPNSAPMLLARGQINTFLGDFDAAEADLRACLKHAPLLGGAWWSLAGLRKQTPESNHVDAIRKALAAVRDDGERAYLAFALHKSFDDLGDIPAACDALDVGCRAKQAKVRHSDADSRALFDEIRAIPHDRLPTAPEQDLGFTPVFVVGMFRSGTTLLEQLLAGNPGVLNAGELYDIPSSLRFATDYQCPTHLDREMVRRSATADVSEVAAAYARGVRWRAQEGHTHITDKLPPNFLNVGVICRAFPQAKILHMVRDPVETCFSNLRELFSGAGTYSYDQDDLARYYRRYHALMAHWREMFPGRIHDIRYTELTRDTATVMAGVAAHCGLEFLPTMVDPRSGGRSVATASTVQVRNPVIARAVPKWHPYRTYLQPLIHGLGELVDG
jgi:tetratricopeptide (TPR) repeat protein